MKTTLHFHKYHGLGNDFILIDAISQRVNIDNASELAIKLCDRHFGVGADGIILACESMTKYEDFVLQKVKEGSSIIGLYPLTNPDQKQEYFKLTENTP